MLVYTTGRGAHGFTLEPSIGEFLLSHRDIRIPERGQVLLVNESYWNRWTDGMHQVVAAFKNGAPGIEAMNVRYIGSLVADFHRNLLGGGIFAYPANKKSPQGKLRLLYEATRSRSSWSRRAARPPTAGSRSSISPPRPSISVRRSSSAASMTSSSRSGCCRRRNRRRERAPVRVRT